jgi:hypothetical protein
MARAIADRLESGPKAALARALLLIIIIGPERIPSRNGCWGCCAGRPGPRSGHHGAHRLAVAGELDNRTVSHGEPMSRSGPASGWWLFEPRIGTGLQPSLNALTVNPTKRLVSCCSCYVGRRPLSAMAAGKDPTCRAVSHRHSTERSNSLAPWPPSSCRRW